MLSTLGSEHSILDITLTSVARVVPELKSYSTSVSGRQSTAIYHALWIEMTTDFRILSKSEMLLILDR